MRHTEDPLAGKLKSNDNFIGAKNPDGSRTVIFETVPAGEQTVRQLSEARRPLQEEALDEKRVPSLLLLAALIVDFLAIHPFEEGNGRVARLLSTYELLRHSYGVARYVSIEQRIFDSKNSYYLALRASQSDWHDAQHDLGPWTTYLLRIIEDAYAALQQRVAAGIERVGSTKREQASHYILTQAPRRFRLAQIADALPDISQATIRDALEGLRADGCSPSDADAAQCGNESTARPPAAITGTPTTRSRAARGTLCRSRLAAQTALLEWCGVDG